MDDFALKPGTPNAYGVAGYDANAVAPGRRPLSSMSPTFMFGPDRVAVLGAKGGSHIITATMIGILGFDDGKDSQQVVALPRYHHQYMPDAIAEEPGALPAGIVSKLQAMGYRVEDYTDPLVLVHAVDWDRRGNVMHAGADPRNPVGEGKVMVTP